MPARIVVHCTNSVDHVTPAMLTAVLKQADLMTLAESLDLPEGEVSAVKAMWTQYRLEAHGTSIDGVQIHWHATQRPIQIRSGPPLAGEIEETLEHLPDSNEAGAARVRAHIRAARHVVEFEMGIDGSQHLAATIGEVLAFFLAEAGDGIVWFYSREFASPEDRGATLWQP